MTNHPSQIQQLLTPRIWRSPRSNFNGDELLDLSDAYTPQVLREIRSHGFDAIWARGKLQRLQVESAFLPELNEGAQAPQRLQSVREVIDRGNELGVRTFLYLNEPLSLRSDHPLWAKHPELRGEPHENEFEDGPQNALCTSAPLVQRWFAEQIRRLAQALPGLGGIILITASEYHTNCWSHHARISLEDPFALKAGKEMQCPRCKRREPSDVVVELLEIWEREVHAVNPQCRVIAWNWSWSMWYPDPQAEIVSKLPKGVELLADWERGGQRSWRGKTIKVDEYSLAYPGPSERFAGSCRIAKQRGHTVHAKLQLGTTHEMATVPNLPLLRNLHRKLAGMAGAGVQGMMGSWCIGTGLTLNTFAVGLFGEDPVGYRDENRFLRELARRYLGITDSNDLLDAWRGFDEAFQHYPFSNNFLYFSPVNYAPAAMLSRTYRDKPLRPSYVMHEDYGDRLDDCLYPFQLDRVTDALLDAATQWSSAAERLRPALQQRSDDPVIDRRRREELGCALMVGHQLLSAHHLFAFHAWRKQAMAARGGMTPPCTVPMDERGRALMQRELDNVRTLLPLVVADRRLGYHEEARGYMYDEQKLRTKIAALEQELTHG